MRFLPRSIKDKRPWSPLQDALPLILLAGILVFLCYRAGLSIITVLILAVCYLAWTIGFWMGLLDVLHTEELEAQAAKAKVN